MVAVKCSRKSGWLASASSKLETATKSLQLQSSIKGSTTQTVTVKACQGVGPSGELEGKASPPRVPPYPPVLETTLRPRAIAHLRAGDDSPKLSTETGILLYLSIAGIRSDQRYAKRALPARLKQLEYASGQESLQATPNLAVCLPFGAPAFDIACSLLVVDPTNEDGTVDRTIELAVAASVEAVADCLA